MIKFTTPKLTQVDSSLVASWEFKGKHHEVELSACLGDDTRFYRDGNTVVVLSINHNLHYVGCMAYCMKESSEIGSVFLQGEQVEDSLGRRGLDLLPNTIASRLYRDIACCF